jgi:uncharacterized protein YcgI (DUF1989 family)
MGDKGGCARILPVFESASLTSYQDRIVLRCLTDVVAAVSSCPMDLGPINGGRITALKLVVTGEDH